MSTTIPLIRVRKKNQVTLPREVMEFFQIESPEYLQYTILQDGVLIRPASPRKEDRLSKIRRLSQSVQSAYGNSSKTDEFIDKQRDEWKK